MSEAVHPFHGTRRTKGVTRKHRILIWECMLGTVNAMNVAGKEKYFDYDWDGARAYAGVDKCSDLRLARYPHRYLDGPRKGQLVLYGIREGK